MTKEKLEENFLVHKLHRKLILVEIEKKVIEISCGLMDDDVYSLEDAVHALMQVIVLIEIERQSVANDINQAMNRA